ncbi:hypothetical protein GGS20DRAFT_562730 [Poronia punctata]|nr:hypothetical protein GGS20DRAFT_562730 [Poronia punctata]
MQEAEKRKVDSWVRPELRPTEYRSFGDAYNDDWNKKLSNDWAIGKEQRGNYPYLAWVQKLSDSGWSYLQLLADFMSIGTAPQRWPDLDTTSPVDGRQLTDIEKEHREKERNRRVRRTKICVLDYLPDEVEKTMIFSDTKLKEHLNEPMEDNVQFRLYVAEDLSREVIEALGHKLSVDPDAFRAHIVDGVWYNVRDRWRQPPSLGITNELENWTQLRYVTIRYFDTNEGEYDDNWRFRKARADEQDFNISRRLDIDSSSKSFWDKDKPKAIVGLTRSKATLWLKPEKSENSQRIGVLLLDPTVTTGAPIWRGRRTLWPMPTYGEKLTTSCLPANNFFDDFTFWAGQKNLFPGYGTNHTPKKLVPMQVLVHLAIAEWVTMVEYIKTRINQLDWEINKPEYFTVGSRAVDDALKKLHLWRRLIPLYREMVWETVRHVERLSARTHSKERHPSLMSHYQRDFDYVLTQLTEYQARIERLTGVVTGIISIGDSRRSIQDNHNIGRLTWLATLFIPLSLISSILSMQSYASDISRETFIIYFATSLPLAVVIATGAGLLSMSRRLKKLKKGAKAL